MCAAYPVPVRSKRIGYTWDDEEGLIVPAGLRGVVVHFGVAEMDETKEIYLVQFENGPDGSLGAPIGCLPDELTQDSIPPGDLLRGAVNG